MNYIPKSISTVASSIWSWQSKVFPFSCRSFSTVILLLTLNKSTKPLSTFRWKVGAISFLCALHFAPVLISNPFPNHGLKKAYSEDLSRWTWLPRTSSTSRGSRRNTPSIGPTQIFNALAFSCTSDNSRAFLNISKTVLHWLHWLLFIGSMFCLVYLTAFLLNPKYCR